jgi:ABC-type Na+ efflux pump permease subunit
MIGTVARTLVVQRLTSPMRLALAATWFGFGVLGVLFTGSLTALNGNAMGTFGYVAAAGLIGQEVSSGVLTMTFARPIRRSDWVLGRWLGALALAFALVVIQVLAATGAALLRHGDVDATVVALKLLEGGFSAVGSCSVLLALSSLAPGLGDLGLVVLGALLGMILNGAGMQTGHPWLARIGEEVQRFIGPTLDPAQLFGQGAVSWFEIASYLSTVSLCVVVAIWAVNRKELSYASG